MAKTYAIKGDWMRDGYLDGRDRLRVTVEDDGSLADPDYPCAQGEIALKCEVWGGDCPIITNGCWTFAPDNDELTRVGIVPRQMIDA